MFASNYKLDKKILLWNGLLSGASVVALSTITYALINNQCNTTNQAMNESDAADLSCHYLEGMYSNLCPQGVGFPPFSELCKQGFQSGYALAGQGVQQFIPAVWNTTYDTCNDYFGDNSTLLNCYQSLTNECWSGAWVGFSWEKSATLVQEAATETCKKIATTSAWAVAGLTFFSGLVSTGMNAISKLQNKNEPVNSSSPLIMSSTNR